MARQWGSLCPEGHGVLVEREEWHARGVIWCPDIEHGGNGRFYRLTEVKEGWFNPSAPKVRSEWQLEQDARVAEASRRREEHEMAKQATRERVKAPAEKVAKTAAVKGQDCLCGCGGVTKGGRFLPGHDARYHSAQKKAAAAAEAANAPAPEPVATEAAEG